MFKHSSSKLIGGGEASLIPLLAPLGALSRRSSRDNRHPIPSHPSTYSFECSKPFYSNLKQTETDSQGSHRIQTASRLHPDCILTASRPHPDRIQTASTLHPHCIQTASSPYPDRVHIKSRLHLDCIQIASKILETRRCEGAKMQRGFQNS